MKRILGICEDKRRIPRTRRYSTTGSPIKKMVLPPLHKVITDFHKLRDLTQRLKTQD